MDRRLSSFISPNSDINENREIGIELIEKCNKTPHVTTKEDKHWFNQDLDMVVDSDIAWSYINPRIKELSEIYPFLVTEWFEEFYRYMPELLSSRRDGTGQIDWNIFFTLAYPLPGGLAVSFRSMINKLNVAQLRIVKEQIKNEVWDNKELRGKIMREEAIPSIYINYLPYQTIRKAIVEREEKEEKARKREIEKSYEKASEERRKLLKPIFLQVLKAQKEGKEVVLQ